MFHKKIPKMPSSAKDAPLHPFSKGGRVNPLLKTSPRLFPLGKGRAGGISEKVFCPSPK
jgi:hypothetical protein